MKEFWQNFHEAAEASEEPEQEQGDRETASQSQMFRFPSGSLVVIMKQQLSDVSPCTSVCQMYCAHTAGVCRCFRCSTVVELGCLTSSQCTGSTPCSGLWSRHFPEAFAAAAAARRCLDEGFHSGMKDKRRVTSLDTSWVEVGSKGNPQ